MLLFRQKPALRLASLSAAFTTSVYRFLSTAPTQEAPSSSPTSDFSVQYLINSCGLPSNKAARAFRSLPYLKSSEKPDSVLQFLRQAGVTEPHINAAALRDPTFLCYDIDNCLKPRLDELRELGFSPSDISLLFSIFPRVFRCTKLQQNVQFWLPFFGSVEKLLRVLKRSFFFLTTNLENTVMPNLAFLQEQCGSARQFSSLVNYFPATITSKPEVFKMNVQRTQELGVPCSSPMFVYALSAVARQKKNIVDAKLCFLESLGFSREEVTLLITKCPTVLTCKEKLIGQKFEFLLKEAGCAMNDVLRNPNLLSLSLGRRLIPRNLVQKLLKSKGIPAPNYAFQSVALLNEKMFLEKFVLPYEGTIPGLHQVYTDACARKTTAAE